VGRTFVGFGFGPIQSGLFLFEAFQSGNFQRLVVSEIDGRLVETVRAAGGQYTVNVARPDGIDAVTVKGVELLNPTVPGDRRQLIEAIAEADELATAIPSIRFYASGGEASIVSLVSEGCRPGKGRIVYAAENHNYAAETLRQAVLTERLDFPDAETAFLNTVVGKMSGHVDDAEEQRRLGVQPMVPGSPTAILVEQFNRILVSKVAIPGLRRGIEVFQEKDQLLPFEEAKLYGHNAIHAMMGYLAAAAGYTHIASLRDDEPILKMARRAFIDESGAALCAKHGDLGDALFTPAGYRAYAEDLLERMTNPYLNDTVARVGRDPARKLGYADRLFGTMRLALQYGIRPTHLAAGAAAGLVFLLRERGDALTAMPGRQDVARLLGELWRDESTEEDAESLIELTAAAMPEVWRLYDLARLGGAHGNEPRP